MNSNKKKSIRDKTGSYDHLSRKEIAAAKAASLKNLQKSMEGVEESEEILCEKEQAKELRKSDYNPENPDARINERANNYFVSPMKSTQNFRSLNRLEHAPNY